MKTLNNIMIRLSANIFLSGLLLAVWAGGCGTDSMNNNESPPSSNGVSFDSGNIAADGSFSYTFVDEGSVEYFCTIHAPDMQGKVTVSAGAAITGQDTVLMEDMQFDPSQITVAPNTKITWINKDAVSHTVTSGNPTNNPGTNPY